MAKPKLIAPTTTPSLDGLAVPSFAQGDDEFTVEFNDLVDCLIEDGVTLANSDYLIVSATVDALITYGAIRNELKGQPVLVTGQRGELTKNPLFTMARQARSDLTDLLQQLGASPRARQYIERSTATLLFQG